MIIAENIHTPLWSQVYISYQLAKIKHENCCVGIPTGHGNNIKGYGGW